VIKILFIFLFVSISLLSCSQSFEERLVMGEEYAKQELKESLSDSTVHNVLSNGKIILTDKNLAIKVVEPVLFSIYGKSNIRRQKPYECYQIKNHWVIMGTLPKGYLGGTFLVIVNAANSEILRISHGK
jgi:hypothetical protein